MGVRFTAVLAAGLALGACTSASGAPEATRSGPGPAGVASVTTTAAGSAAAPGTADPPATTALPAAAPDQNAVAEPAPARPVATRATGAITGPAAGEVLADAKQLASDVAVRLTSYQEGTAWSDVVGAIPIGPAARQALATTAAPLHHPGQASTGTVVYAQLGGFRAERASVMVVLRQVIGPDSTGGGAGTQTRTLDVRLARSGGRWAFEELASIGGEPVARPAQLPTGAAAVVDNPRIQLPDSARWDIYRGAISAGLLTVLAAVAERTPIAVAVLESGHPHNVFGTGRVSNHTGGRAVDVYQVGERRVVDGRSVGSPVHDLAVWLHRRFDLSQLGSPWRLGPGSFTDIVHQDHLHIAVRG